MEEENAVYLLKASFFDSLWTTSQENPSRS